MNPQHPGEHQSICQHESKDGSNATAFEVTVSFLGYAEQAVSAKHDCRLLTAQGVSEEEEERLQGAVPPTCVLKWQEQEGTESAGTVFSTMGFQHDSRLGVQAGSALTRHMVVAMAN